MSVKNVFNILESNFHKLKFNEDIKKMRRKISLRGIALGIPAVLLIAGFSTRAFSYPAGVAGRTLKPGSTNGCTCHSSSPNTAVLISVTGPASLAPGATGTYTLSVNRSSGTFNTGGIDIAVDNGTLGIGSSTGIKILSGEVVQSAKFTGPTTKTFTLTAPGTPGTITIYCTRAAGTNPPAWNNGANFTVNVVTGIKQIEETAASYSLSQNFPNPFNPTTNISFSIPKAGPVKITVYDITGKVMNELVNENLAAGKYNTTWDATKYSSGVYFCKMQAGEFTEMKKMTLIK